MYSVARNHIPTARYQNFSDYTEAKKHLESVDYKVVLKAAGYFSLFSDCLDIDSNIATASQLEKGSSYRRQIQNSQWMMHYERQ